MGIFPDLEIDNLLNQYTFYISHMAIIFRTLLTFPTFGLTITTKSIPLPTQSALHERKDIGYWG
jgi:hypothetical protein